MFMMEKMMSEEAVAAVTLGEIQDLHKDISKFDTIGEWKKRVKAFAVKHNLTDREAIKIANMELK